MAERSGFEIAVIGMACRFPGAPDLDAYWRVLRDGVESVSFFSEAELLAAGVAPELVRRADYVRARGVLPDAESLDAAFFDIPPAEAALMDPQHRVLLELAWTALEHSGHAPEHVDGLVGMYAGTHENTYAARVSGAAAAAGALGPFAVKIGVEKDYQATRVAYKLGLDGPALSVQTACSTSLVATHLAVQGLLAGDCDLALAGGATVHAPQRCGYLYEPGGIFSPDGHCRSFDAGATGAVSSNGGGVVVLRRLEDALAAGDTVHAVILGSAVTNDGARRAGFTAPGVAGQARAVRAAQQAAGVDPATIGYVEAHGSATPLGDPIEVAALTEAFRAGTDATGYCLLGSVKSNIGHTHAAAGVAGLIKTVLALRHRRIPASLHFTEPNPRIDFASSPFRVADRASDWAAAGPRRAGVSSFGLGGTNAHVVIEEAPPPAARPAPADGPEAWEVVTVSARDPRARAALQERHGSFLAEATGVRLAAVAHTLQRGRRAFGYRAAAVGRDPGAVAQALAGRAPGLLHGGPVAGLPPEVAFLLPGVGDLHPGAGAELYDRQPAFREALDECAELLRPLLDLDLRDLLWKADAAAPREPDLAALLGRRAAVPTADPLAATLVAQPATLAFEYALAALWQSWGVRPAALLGYSLGELTAACLAGVFRLADVLMLATERARLIERLPAGAMLAVPLPAHRVREQLRGDVWLAADEGPALCVVSGAAGAVDALSGRLAAQGVHTRPLRTRHAFHSPLLAGVADEVTATVAAVERRPPRIPYLSNVTGDWISADEAVDPGYWARHLCQPVRFAAAVDRLWRMPGQVLLEVGPGQALTSAALQAVPAGAAPGRLAVATLPSLVDDRPETATALTAAAKLWVTGVDVDWPATRGGDRPHRVPLPTYPFQRRRHWIEPDAGPGAPAGARQVDRGDPATWLTVPVWVSTPPPPPPPPAPPAPPARRRWLILPDGLGVGRALADRLVTAGHNVVVAGPGGGFDALLARLAATGRPPDVVVHLRTLHARADLPGLDETDGCLRRGFFDLLELGRCLARHLDGHPLHLAVATTGAFQVTGEDTVVPAHAAALGPCGVLPLEHAGWTASCVDMYADPARPDATAGLLLAELAGPGAPVAAYRGRRRWTRELRGVPAAAPPEPAVPLRPGGRYVVVGGFGGVGLSLAGLLADRTGGRIALLGRGAVPARTGWDAWLAAHDGHDPTSRRIRAIRDLEARGAEVLPVRADIADPEQARAAIALVDERFGGVDGVVHAAGVLAGGLAQARDPAAAAAVLAAKTAGVVALDRALGDRRLDFLALCASTVGVFGGVGQVDYAAANAFLDAYAQRRATDERGGYAVSIDWDGWRDVGMVADAAARRRAPVDDREPADRVTGRPLLDGRQGGAAGRVVYRSDLSTARHWLLDEHRMHGRSVVAGTIYLELVVEALHDLGLDWPVELRDVSFLAPCVVPDGTGRRLYLVLEPDAGGYRFAFTSRASGAGSGSASGSGGGASGSDTGRAGGPGAEPAWVHHAGGWAGPAAGDGSAPRATVPGADPVPVRDHTGPMTLGPRSRCLGAVAVRGTDAVAEIALPGEYHADLAGLLLHPSLTDIATGFVNMHLGPVFRMPMAYARIRAYGPLPAAFVSHVRAADPPAATPDVTTYDVTLAGPDGRVLVEVTGLTMKRPTELEARLAALADGTADAPVWRPAPRAGSDPAGPAAPATRAPPGRTEPPSVLVGALDRGLTAREGAAAFAAVLERGLTPQVIVAPRPVEAVRAELRRPWSEIAAAASAADDGHAGDGHDDRDGGPAHPRPALATAYVAPRDPVEREVAGLWRRLLGIDHVGVHDTFADLGGNSLLAVRLASLVRETQHVDLPLPRILAAGTVAGLAELITEARAGRPASPSDTPRGMPC